MKHCAGLDVSVNETAICIVDERSESLARLRTPVMSTALVEIRHLNPSARVRALCVRRQGSAIDGMADCAAAAVSPSSPALWRPAPRLRGLTAALQPSVRHPCRSTAHWDCLKAG
jgi:hypothetical protein